MAGKVFSTTDPALIKIIAEECATTRYTLYDALQEEAGVRRSILEEEDRESVFIAELTAHGDRYEAIIKAITEAKNAQIKVLVTALEEIRDMTVCDALGLRYSRARQIAVIAIKGGTNDRE